jgi:hypothetical protein
MMQLTKTYAVFVDPEELASIEDFTTLFQLVDVVVTHSFNLKALQKTLKQYKLYDFLSIVVVKTEHFNKVQKEIWLSDIDIGNFYSMLNANPQ